MSAQFYAAFGRSPSGYCANGQIEIRVSFPISGRKRPRLKPYHGVFHMRHIHARKNFGKPYYSIRATQRIAASYEKCPQCFIYTGA